MIRNEVEAAVEYEDEDVLVIHDIHAQAPHHVLIIPKKHIAKVADMEAADTVTLGNLIFEAHRVADRNGWEDYRLVFNNGEGAGQSVFHIHLHLLAARPLGWPPG